jgi:hypothetical protein
VGFLRHKRIGLYLHGCLWLTAVVLLVVGLLSLRQIRAPAQSALERRIAQVDFRGTRLDEALKQLGDAAGVRVVLDRRAFSSLGVNLSEPVFLRMKDVDLATAFERLNFAASDQFTLEPRDGEVLVTLKTAMPTVVRIYDIHDLVEKVMSPPFFTKTPEEIKKIHDMPYLGPKPIVDREDFAARIAHIIGNRVAPDAWSDVGGTEILRVTETGQLVVSGPRSVHQRIDDLLRRLRACEAESTR